MTRNRSLSFANALSFAAGVALLLALPTALLTASPAAAQDTLGPLPWWIELASDVPSKEAFDPLQAGLARRPSVLLETSYYVYGPGSPFGSNGVEVNLTVDPRNFPDAVSLYLSWQNRETGEMRYYNMPQGAFVNQQIDLFGSGGAPVPVKTPDLENFRLFGADSAFGPVPGNIPTATGQYQFVLEVRTANGNQVIQRGNAMYNQIDGIVQKGGNITASETWTANNAYLLTSPVNVQSGATLTIEAGTVVLGTAATTNPGVIVIRQGAQIQAIGNAMQPIIMTSDQVVGERAAGDWGGLVINGFAPTNQGTSPPPEGEGDSGPYGGNNAADSSGRISYVRVEFAGVRFNERNELNGIALQGVGSNTQIDHVQVHFNADDGIEFFGGTANAKYVLITDCEDDSLDWTFGWQGKLQHFVAIQRTGVSDKLIEADNFDDDNDALPRSSPMIANATFIGPAGKPDLVEPSEALRLRRGTGVHLTHFLVTLAKEEAVRVTEDSTLALVGGELQLENAILHDLGVLTDNADVDNYLRNIASNIQIGANPRLPNPQGLPQPDVAPANGSPARNAGALPQAFQADSFFDAATWIGGVNPNAPWINDGWTTFSDN